MKLNDISLARKLWASVLVLLLAMLAVGLWTQARIHRAHSAAAERTAQAQELITLSTRWRAVGQHNNDRVFAFTLSTEAAVTEAFSQRVKIGMAASTELQKRIAEIAQTEADKRAIALIGERRAVILAKLKEANALKASDPSALKAFMEKDYAAVVQLFDDAQVALVQLEEAQLQAVRKETEDELARTMWIGAAVTVLVFCAGVAWIAVLVPSINRPLQRAVNLAEAIAAGDLTQSAHDDRRDELGRLLQGMTRMAEQLRGVVAGVRQSVNSVASASTEIASGNLDLSTRTEQTASNLQETASSLEQLTSTVSNSADVARQATELAGSAASAAARGGDVVGHVVNSMQSISESSRKIGDIIGVIDGIAFQTNILALNAAVEAARAGEQGRGFAVVAGEVRTLAQRSAQAAKEIKTLIGSSVDSVEVGARQVVQAREVMTEIVASVNQVSGLIGEMSSAASEQRDGIGQLHQAVHAIDEMTQQNAALVEESSAAATSLNDQARRLSEQVAVFKIAG